MPNPLGWESGSSTLLRSMSMVANSWHSSLMNSSDLKQHQSPQKYFLKRKATLVRHMATQNTAGPSTKLKMIPVYLREAYWKRDRVWNNHHIPITTRNLVNKSKLKINKIEINQLCALAHCSKSSFFCPKIQF